VALLLSSASCVAEVLQMQQCGTELHKLSCCSHYSGRSWEGVCCGITCTPFSNPVGSTAEAAADKELQVGALLQY
jgi:hypothetical protein